MKNISLWIGVAALLGLVAPSAYAAGTTMADKLFTDKTTGMAFIRVDGGCYKMGDIFGDGAEDEKPVHEVCVNSFYMGKYEVTQKQWQKIMGNNPSTHKECGLDCPVESVSWNDAQEFIHALNEKSQVKFRLPTESEWEYAARNAGKQDKFPGGSNPDDVAWYDTNSENSTHKVGQKKPNSLGIFDLAGNVAEWCSDWYGADYYAKSPDKYPQGPEAGEKRVLRGGAYNYGANAHRSVNRNNDDPDSNIDEYGLRLVVTAP